MIIGDKDLENRIASARERDLAGSPVSSTIAGSNSVSGILVPDIGPISEAAFPPIAGYAFLSDCESSCLVAPSGAIEWLCLPRPHDPSLFGSILDRTAGSFRFGPPDITVPAHREYVPGTMALATSWQTHQGWLLVHDFLAVGPWEESARADHDRRTPRDFDARHVLVRIATCVHGSVDVELDCEPSFDYGRDDARWSYCDPSHENVETTNSGPVSLHLSGNVHFGIEGRKVRAPAPQRRSVGLRGAVVVLGALGARRADEG